MRVVRLSIVISCLVNAAVAQAASGQTSDVTLFRLFLKDGTNVVSYGEYARVDSDVVFAMPLGSSSTEPRLQVISLSASLVDWPRTERYALSARYQQYAATRGEADFAALSAEVAAMLNEIALTTEPDRALEIADRARRKLIDWPSEHFGYRQHDIGDIVALMDEAVSGLRTSSGESTVQLSLVATVPTIPVEPVLGMITPRDQVARIVTLVDQLPRSADRIALLRAALEIVRGPDSSIASADDVASVRRSLDAQLREELSADARYGSLAKRLTDQARRAAASASVAGVERTLESVDREDARLGRERPEMVRALRSEIEAQLESARDLRLRRDQWLVRREIHRGYVNSVSAQVTQLVKAHSSLDAIRRLAGPAPSRLTGLKGTLGGGAAQLQQVVAPEQMRAAHELLVNAWRFAESAIDARLTAVVSGDLDRARQASSAAAGSLLLLARAQAEIRSVLEPPKPR